MKQRKEASLGQLWLELFRFYTLDFALEENIISIRLKQLLSREVKSWPRRRLAIEGEGGEKQRPRRPAEGLAGVELCVGFSPL